MPALPSPDEVADKARFVFSGTVRKLNASTVPTLSDKKNAVVVRIDETLHAPQTLSHYTEKTLRFRSAAIQPLVTDLTA